MIIKSEIIFYALLIFVMKRKKLIMRVENETSFIWWLQLQYKNYHQAYKEREWWENLIQIFHLITRLQQHNSISNSNAAQ